MVADGRYWLCWCSIREGMATARWEVFLMPDEGDGVVVVKAWCR